MIVLGLDPSLTAYGWAIVDVSESPPKVLEVGCVRTAPLPKNKRHIYQTDQDYVRLAVIAKLVTKIVGATVDRIVCEAPAGARHAKAAKALGQTLGLTIGVCVALGRQIRFVQAHEVKQAIGGHPNATKTEVADGVFDIAGWMTKARDKDSREGESDAVAVALTLRAELTDGAKR